VNPRRLAARIVGAVARRAGFTLGPLHPVDLTDVTTDPVEALYRSRGRSCLVRAPVSRLRGAGGFAFDVANPFVETLDLYGRGGCPGYVGSPMERYYAEWQPDTLASAFGLEARTASEFLGRPADYCKVRPWESGYHRQYFADRLTRKEFRKVREREGLAGQEVAGTLMFGPVSESFGEITFRRMARVFDSVREKGYRPAIGGEHMRATVLIRNRDWRLVVHSGKHRAIACAAADCPEVVVMLEPTSVRHEDAASWPNVRDGLFTLDEARTVFDRWFDGRHPWLDGRRKDAVHLPT
jgi:hypothetical protein